MVELASKLPEAGADDVVYLIDLSNYVFRAYHALPPLMNSRGEPTNATLGTLNMLNRMVEDQRPHYMAVVMDSRGRGFRHEIDPSYKANRSAAPPDLTRQIQRTREIFEAYRVPIFQLDGYEADDLIATLVKQAKARGLRVVIASSDKDLLQLAETESVVSWDAMRSSVYGPAEVQHKFGVSPRQLRELLALTGDSSDNVPGAPGVGPKTAAALLHQFGSLDAVFARLDQVKRPKLREALAEAEPVVRRGYQLVGLRDDADIELELDALRYGNPDVPRLRELFTELQFTRFLDLLDDAEQQDEPEAAGDLHTRVIARREELEALVADARLSGNLAVTAFGPSTEAMTMPLTGLALAARRGDAAYLPIGHRYLTAPAQLSLDTVREVLGPVLGDPSVAKLGHDLKLTQVVLAHHAMPVLGASFDSMLASYLLDPESTHKLAIVAERDARMKWTDFESLSTTKKKGLKSSIDEMEIGQVADWAAAHAEAALRLAERQRPKLEKERLLALFRELEMPLSDVLVEMEQVGVLVDPAPLAFLGVSMTAELAALEERAYEAARHRLNLGSPKQLETVLFDELGLKVTKRTKTGRSTDHEALEAIEDDHPLPKLVLEHRGIAKLLGTYVETLPRLIHEETGRIHTRWDQAVTATGRISSKDPNLQNIPIRTEHGKRIRDAFVAPEGKLILSADYSQIELRVLAHLSHDPKLVDAFNQHADVHVRTAMEVFGVPEASVTPTMRAQSKTVNFGVIYGMGAVALAKRLGITRNDAKGFIDAYFERYRGVRTFMDETLAKARANKAVRTLLGRRRLLTDLESSNHAKRSYAERIAQNTPIQGSAADLLKLAMVKLAAPVVPGARMVLTVHDELVFEVPEAHIEEAAAKTKAAMESVFPLDVPLVVDVGWGHHWGEAH